MAEDKTGQEDSTTLEGLADQIKNLNTGIASYRDKAQEAESKATAAEAKANAAEKSAADLRKTIEDNKSDPKDDKAVKLNDADQKKLEAWAKAQGFVTKNEMEEQRVSLFQDSIKSAESQAVSEFMERHPEYSDKEKWDAVKKEFEQYKQPTSLTGYRSLLSKIHGELSAVDEKSAEIRAKDEQKKRLGLGGRGNANDNSTDDMTMEKLRERYPNLSEEQITSRLSEINDIAVARAKKVAARKK